MPTYSFRNKETGEEFDKFMRIFDRESFLEENPHFETIITSAAIGDSVRLGVTRRDTGFKNVLQQIHERTPGSDLKKMNAF